MNLLILEMLKILKLEFKNNKIAVFHEFVVNEIFMFKEKKI